MNNYWTNNDISMNPDAKHLLRNPKKLELDPIASADVWFSSFQLEIDEKQAATAESWPPGLNLLFQEESFIHANQWPIP